MWLSLPGSAANDSLSVCLILLNSTILFFPEILKFSQSSNSPTTTTTTPSKPEPEEEAPLTKEDEIQLMSKPEPEEEAPLTKEDEIQLMSKPELEEEVSLNKEDGIQLNDIYGTKVRDKLLSANTNTYPNPMP